MKPLIDEIWNLVKIGAESVLNEDIELNKDAYDIFSNEFKSSYDDILTQYMSDDVTALDRHKVAAIIIISLIKAGPLRINDLSDDKIFLGNENLAFQIGLSYMQHELNKILLQKGINRKIAQYKMPEAIACETYYIDIVCRNLYFTKVRKDWGLNPLDLSERLFLIEYITLVSEGIEPKKLKSNDLSCVPQKNGSTLTGGSTETP